MMRVFIGFDDRQAVSPQMPVIDDLQTMQINTSHQSAVDPITQPPAGCRNPPAWGRIATGDVPMMRVFIGFDDRQAVSYHVLSASIMKYASKPVAITPLVLPTLPMKRQGLTPFTFSRFICPWLCAYKGKSVFLDADMMLRADIAELFRYTGDFDVAVVKNKMRFEWSSVMLFDNARCEILTPEYIDDLSRNPMKMQWAEKIGELPPEWNHLVGYDEPNPNAKLVHFTQGVPAWPETMNCEHAMEWRSTMLELIQAKPWAEIMGSSVHAKPVLERLQAGEAA